MQTDKGPGSVQGEISCAMGASLIQCSQAHWAVQLAAVDQSLDTFLPCLHVFGFFFLLKVVVSFRAQRQVFQTSAWMGAAKQLWVYVFPHVWFLLCVRFIDFRSFQGFRHVSPIVCKSFRQNSPCVRFRGLLSVNNRFINVFWCTVKNFFFPS